jgi:aminoglycoside phosphotransferase (APT) family kinase protein
VWVANMTEHVDPSRTTDARPMHENEFVLSTKQAETIIHAEFPQWRELEVRPLASGGTVNRIFRLGDELSARFPRVIANEQGAEFAFLQEEVDTAQELRGATHFPIPEQVAIGHPTPDYPGHWAVHTWLEGTSAAEADLSGSSAFAKEIVRFVLDVRAIPVRGRSFRGGGRGGDLKFAEEWMETCFNESEELLDVKRLRRYWSEARELPQTAPDTMTHGDLIATNLLVDDHSLVGVLDIGGLGPADPALDLMGLWSLFDDDRRKLVRRELNCTDLEWWRGQAWAFQQAMGAVWYYITTNPTMAELARRALQNISEAGHEG